MPSFRISSRQFFLTYPQADNINLDDLYNHFIEWVQDCDNEAQKVLVAEEQHLDGHKHFHVYIKFEKKITTTNQFYFDYGGKHPNIQGARSEKAVVEYCTKDGNYRANFNVCIKPLTMGEIIDQANNRVEFLLLMEKHQPGALVRGFGNVSAFADHRYKTPDASDPVRAFPDDFNAFIPQEIYDWKVDLESHVRGVRDMKSLWLHGPTRLGKTQLARSLGCHSYMANTWNFTTLRDDVSYAVLDDIDWDSIKWQYRALFGLQSDVSFTGKYKRPTKFVWGIPIIFLSNELPYFPPETKAWMDQNVTFVHIYNKLYN